ncbi:MAG TPA: MerR family transcriptional regulator [Candidatus Limnocylindrales bacterium]|nr:MerR family transcriptional regulator [Candidatus Limnocylindrales bacterium]
MEQHDAVYTMAVAARLSGMHPQTLRKYERAGLIRPARQAGNQRMYSGADIRRLHRIQFFVDVRGLNVAGLALVLAMIDRLEAVGDDASRADLRTAVDDALAMGQEQSPEQ